MPADSLVADPSAKRLNVLALPTRTTLLFSLIVLAIGLPVASSLESGSGIVGPFFVLGMILLTLRAFLRHPILQLRHCLEIQTSQRYPSLLRRWNELAKSTAGINPPRLVLEQLGSAEPHTFGTFTRKYMAMPDRLAPGLERALESTRDGERASGEAVLLHELAHFAHHDVWMTFFAESLLKVTIAFVTLDFFVNALSPWLYNGIISFFDFSKLFAPELVQLVAASDPQMAQVLVNPPRVPPVVWMRYEIFIFTAHWPLVLGSIVLLVLYWRALLRTRELYADARVAEWQESAQGLWGGVSLVQILLMTASSGESLGEKLAAWRERLLSIRPPGWSALRRWLDVHPRLEARRQALSEPFKIYGGDWEIALSAGGTVVLVNLSLGSLFLSRFTRGPNSAPPFLIGFVVLSLSLLPFLCQYPERRREFTRRVTRTVLGLTLIKLIPQLTLALVITIGILGDPALIDQAAYALVPGAGANTPPTSVPVEFVLEQFVVRPALLFACVMPVVLMLFLSLDARIKRRILRWYSSRFVVQNPARAFITVTLLLAAALGLMLLPLLDWLTNPTAHDLFDPLTLFGMALGTLGSIAAAIWFSVLDRRHADRCPQCGASSKGDYWLGKTCGACGQTFHPRLLAPGTD
ncbi:MAG: M48 family metalloprotease [Chloroflexi bacterium]|nr:M48 family metalloprotease [Chloroflexota bacterium]